MEPIQTRRINVPQFVRHRWIGLPCENRRPGQALDLTSVLKQTAREKHTPQPKIEQGARVRVVDSDKADEFGTPYNGSLGIVTKYLAMRDQWGVKLDSGDKIGFDGTHLHHSPPK